MYNFTVYLTTDCNFKCTYCYENYQDHLFLTEETVIKVMDFIMGFGKEEKVVLNFLGGEPLLKKNLIYLAVDYIKKRYPDRTVQYYITTNASLMDDSFIDFIKEYGFQIRLSFDGNQESHDLNRFVKNGISSYDTILQNIIKVSKQQIPYSIRMTITENTINHMFENVQFLHQKNLNHICLIMDVNLKMNDRLLAEFERQIEMILEYYIHESQSNHAFTIDQFDGKMFNFLCDFGNCFSMCDAGISNFKIMPDGSIYPCGFVTGEKNFIIGNIEEGIRVEQAKELVSGLYDRSSTKCQNCEIRDFCHGMKCGYMNYINTGKVNVPSDAECHFEHVFYKAMIKLISYYLSLPGPQLKEKLGKHMDYIKNSGLKLSKYGEAVNQCLTNHAV